jgi:hypothetical protein
MNHAYLHLAADELNLSPLSIEPDGTMWTGLEAERKDLTAAQVSAVTKRAEELAAVKAAAREALLTRLGMTADEAQLLLGGM